VKHGKSRQILANETSPTIQSRHKCQSGKRHVRFKERGFIAALTLVTRAVNMPRAIRAACYSPCRPRSRL
jgi:hypothetical protein